MMMLTSEFNAKPGLRQHGSGGPIGGFRACVTNCEWPFWLFARSLTCDHQCDLQVLVCAAAELYKHWDVPIVSFFPSLIVVMARNSIIALLSVSVLLIASLATTEELQ